MIGALRRKLGSRSFRRWWLQEGLWWYLVGFWLLVMVIATNGVGS